MLQTGGERGSETTLDGAQKARSRGAASKSLGRLAAAAVVALGALDAVTCLRAALNITYPYALETAEGTIHASARLAAAGQSIYGIVDKPPYVLTVYNPVFIYFSALLAKAFGPALSWPRPLAAAFLAGSAAAIYLLVARETRLRSAALVAALFFVAERHVFSRAGFAVTDYPALFFSLLGLCLWTVGPRARYASAAVFALAFFTKQSSVAAAAAAFVSLFLEGARRESVRLFLVFLALVAAGLAVCGGLFGKAFFVNTLGYATVSSFMLRASMARVGGAVACYIVPFVGWIYLSRASLKDRALILPSLYVLFGLALSVSSGRVGGGSTYFFDLAAGLSVIVGLMWARGTRALTSPGRVRAFAALAALQLALATYGILPGIFTGEMPALSQLGGKTQAASLSDAAIAEAFGSSSGMILCREPAFGIGTNAQNAGPDPYKLNQLMSAGMVSREVLLEPIREKRFSLVIVPDRERTWRLFDDDVLAAIESNYELSWAKHGQRFFAPRSGPAAPGAVGEQPRTPAGIPDMD